MTLPTRLKATQVATTRTTLALRQDSRCALCQSKLGLSAPLDPVLDHDHRTGAVRGVLHRGCNSLLGKIENNAARYGVRDVAAFTGGVAGYLRRHMVNTTGLLHPTHKSPDEKREARNKKARATRAKARGNLRQAAEPTDKGTP